MIDTTVLGSHEQDSNGDDRLDRRSSFLFGTKLTPWSKSPTKVYLSEITLAPDWRDECGPERTRPSRPRICTPRGHSMR